MDPAPPSEKDTRSRRSPRATPVRPSRKNSVLCVLPPLLAPAGLPRFTSAQKHCSGELLGYPLVKPCSV